MLGGAFEGVEDKVSPFGYKRGEGIDAGSGEPQWIVSKERYKFDAIFDTLNPVDGKVTGAGKPQICVFYFFCLCFGVSALQIVLVIFRL